MFVEIWDLTINISYSSAWLYNHEGDHCVVLAVMQICPYGQAYRYFVRTTGIQVHAWGVLSSVHPDRQGCDIEQKDLALPTHHLPIFLNLTESGFSA